MQESTGEVIKLRSADPNPGAYYEMPKTHKFDEESKDCSNGFPARGIVSGNNTPTESLQDYCEMLVNPGMQALPTYIKDSKQFIQIIEQINEKGPLKDTTNLVTADMEGMYPNMPLDLSEKGVKGQPGVMPTDTVLEGLKLCHETNVFEFKDQMYRQKIGHAIGQKQAPPVVCVGAGQVERKFLNLPRDIIYDDQPRPIDDPIFNKVSDMAEEFRRFIDDVVGTFAGNKENADWFFSKQSVSGSYRVYL